MPHLDPFRGPDPVIVDGELVPPVGFSTIARDSQDSLIIRRPGKSAFYISRMEAWLESVSIFECISLEM